MTTVANGPDEGNTGELARREPDTSAPDTRPRRRRPRAHVVTFLEPVAEEWILAAVEAHTAAITRTPRGSLRTPDELEALDLAHTVDALRGSGAHLARTILEHMERPESYAPGAPLTPRAARELAHAAMFAAGRAAALADVGISGTRISRAVPAAEVLAALPFVAALAPPPPPPSRGRTLEHLAGFAGECIGTPCAPLAVLLRALRWCGLAPVPPWQPGTPAPVVPDSGALLLYPGARWITDTLRAYLKRARRAVARGAPSDTAAASVASLALRALGHDPRPFGGATRRAASRGYDLANPARPRQPNGRGPKLLP